MVSADEIREAFAAIADALRVVVAGELTAVDDSSPSRRRGGARSAGADWAVLTAPGLGLLRHGARRAGRRRALAVRRRAGGRVVAADGHAVLVAADADIDPERRPHRATQSYEAFALPPGGPGLDGLYLDAVSAALAESGVGGTVGVEPATCPDGVRGLLARRRRVDLTAALRDARAGQDGRGGRRPCARARR